MTEFEDVRCEHERARAHAYTYVCARGLPAYFGILIARGRPSPLPLSPFSPLRALRPISPRLVPYRAPAPRLHPRGTPPHGVLVFPPRDITHPEKLGLYAETAGHTYSHVCRLLRRYIYTRYVTSVHFSSAKLLPLPFVTTIGFLRQEPTP